MALFDVLVTRKTTETAHLDIEAGSAEEAEDCAVQESTADDRGMNWHICDTDTTAKVDGSDDAEDDYKPASRVSKIEQLIKAGDYEAGPTAVCDILTDLRHYCDAKGIDFAHQDEAAYDHYREEAREARRES